MNGFQEQHINCMDLAIKNRENVFTIDITEVFKEVWGHINIFATGKGRPSLIYSTINEIFCFSSRM